MTVYGSPAVLAEDLRDRRTTPEMRTAMEKKTANKTCLLAVAAEHREDVLLTHLAYCFVWSKKMSELINLQVSRAGKEMFAHPKTVYPA